VHPQPLFDDVDELLRDPADELVEVLDYWLLHE
jgi:hypothetical protein